MILRCRILRMVLVAMGSLLAAALCRAGVQADLVSSVASVQPGKPFTVAFHMQHDPHWHTYWVNAGTGLPTTFTWKLPDGFKADEIQWPTPTMIKDMTGKVTGYGYEGENLLLVQITPPASLTAGNKVTLKLHAEWLVCEEVCMPGGGDFVLTLPISETSPLPDEQWAKKIAEFKGHLPMDLPPGWTTEAKRNGDKVELHLKAGSGARPPAKNFYFFSSDGLIDYEKPQDVQAEPDGYVFRLSVAEGAETKTDHLVGIIRVREGWSQPDEVVGLTVNASLRPPASTVPPATGGVTGGSSSPGGQVGGTNTAGGGGANLFATLGLAFLGGLILNFMPCVFPVLGIKILGFVNQSGHNRGRITTHGLVFALGVLVSFWALAGVLLMLRASGAQLGWGFQLQSPAFVFGMAVFLLIFALNLSGLFEIGLSLTGAGGEWQRKEGLAGSFLTGALATLVATPCSAPFLAPALGAALLLPPAESLLVFTAIALGLALPYLLLSVFPQAIRFLPKSGAWMETFKQFMAFPLYATVGWLLWVLAGQTKDDDNALLLIAFGFVLVAMAAWAYGRFGQAYGNRARQLAGRVGAVLLLAGGLATGWPKEAPAVASDGSYQVTWEKWSPEAIAAAQSAGKFVYVDFTARWCATCQANKAAVFHDDDLLAELKKKNVVLLRGDWTNRDAKITAELARWNRSAVPFNLIYAPGRAAPVILPELLTPGLVLDALRKS